MSHAGGSGEERSLFGRLAVARRMISEEQLAECLEIQSGDRRRLGEILVSRGYLSEDEVERLVRFQQERLRGRRPGAPALAQGFRAGDSVGEFRVERELSSSPWSASFEVLKDRESYTMTVLEELAAGSIGLRMRRDAMAVCGTGAPRSVARVVAVGEVEGRPWVVEEWAEDGGLDELLKGGALSLADALDLTIAIGEGLAHAHRCGVIHGDLRASAVRRRGDGSWFLSGFGCTARSLRELPAREWAAMGHLAPEQLEGGSEVGTRADIYGLGQLFYHVLTGRPALSGSREAVLLGVAGGRYPAPSKLRSELPRGADAICFQAMAKDPTKRYGGIGGVVEDCLRLKRGEPVSARSPSVLGRLFGWLRSK